MEHAEPCFHVRDPKRYKAERDALMRVMAACSPMEIQLRDGRRGFRLELRVPDVQGESTDANGVRCKQYTVLLVWNNDHPSSRYGNSVTCYFVKPDVMEMEQDYRKRYARSIPHMITAVHPLTGTLTRIPSTERLEPERGATFTILTAARQLYDWLCLYTASKSCSKACRLFSGH